MAHILTFLGILDLMTLIFITNNQNCIIIEILYIFLVMAMLAILIANNRYIMKKLLTIVLLALIVAGCEDKTISEQDKNQPIDPTKFSLVGKKYVCDRSNNNPYGESFFIAVLDFFSTDSAVWYSTTHRDLSPIKDDGYNPCRYKLEYPNLTLVFGIDPTYLVFQDTNTLYCRGWEQTFTILK